jgi:hypothetical protein
MLFIPLFVALCVKLDPGTQNRMHSILQMVSEPTLVVSWAHTDQLRRIWWRTGQGRGYVHMTRGSSGRDTVWYVCC